MAKGVWDAVTGIGEGIVKGFKLVSTLLGNVAKLATSIPEGVSKGIRDSANVAYKANDELVVKLYDTSNNGRNAAILL
ncbi:hypothetical protein [Paenibacillus larvae]|uniref:hypothetical protein n=1 Tax=Paenibacillus larvae TaxID=1464 RepID=UPI0028902EDB|nr:hypothetical protein [Paenibacillus larvae]MDT2194844.1 hypothetical protein [Paenibacillus larvae]